jgi:hypothetical protein
MTDGRFPTARELLAAVVVWATIAAGCGVTVTPRRADAAAEAGTIVIGADGGGADRPAGSDADRPADSDAGGDAATDVPVALAIAPASVQVAAGSQVTLAATEQLDDGSAIDVTATAVWISSNEAIATVTAGQVTGQEGGSVLVSAYIGPLSASARVEVLPGDVPPSLAVVPALLALPQGSPWTLQAIETVGDRGTAAVAASWTVSDPTLATVDGNGVVTALARTGPVDRVITVTASAVGTTATAKVTIIAPSLMTLTVTPAVSYYPVGTTATFRATGTFDDGATYDLSALVTWSVSSPDLASISSTGTVAILGEGTFTVLATYSRILASATVTGVRASPN